MTDQRLDWFRVLAETTSTAIFVYRDRFLYSNRAFAELTGYSVAELLAIDPMEVVHPDFRDLVGQRRKARLAGQDVPQQYEMLLLTKTGEERWVHYTAGRILLDGQTAAVGTAFDITDRKQVELALRKSEERLHLAQQAAGLVSWDWNLLNDELIILPGSLATLGLEASTTPLTSAELFERLVHQEDGERVLQAIRRTLREGSEYAVEHRFLAPGGGERWLSARGRPIRDENGWVVRMVGVSADITERKLSELALRESSDRMRLIFEQVPALLWTTDRNLRFTSCSGAGLASLGLKPNQLLGVDLLEFLNTGGADSAALAAHRRALAGEASAYEQRLSGFIYQNHVEPLRDAFGNITGTIGVGLDVSDQRRAEEALRRERERADTTLASIDDGVIRTNAFGLVEYLNPVAERLLSISAEEARGRVLEEIYRVVDEDSRKPLLNPLLRCLRESRPVMLPGRRVMVARDGSECVIRDSAAPIRGADGQVLGAVLAFKDVTAVREMERAMTHLANHDGLTGLLNRAAFERRLGHALESSGATGESLALLQLDLGQLKVVNDTCGHWAGDEMVRQVARLLAGFVQHGGALARLGAEEFGLFFESLPVEQARRQTEVLRSLLDGYRFTWEDRQFALRPAIGLVMATAGDKVSALMIATDIACSLAKEGRHGRIHEYQADDEAMVERYREMHWIHRIYKALQEDKFRLYCQPIRPLLGGEEDGLLGEVLLRMVGEDGELVLPRTFVPAAERYRLMALVDRWVVSRSFELLAQRATVTGKTVSRLAINLSGESLDDELFLEFVLSQLERSRISPHQILFEITETVAIANLPGAMRFIADLQEKGVDFVLDDFGSGLSSFAYLKNLPVNYLKVAGEFVRGLTESPMHRTLVRSIHQIGHELGLKTIAEGVENPEMLAILEEIQVDYVQGFWIARPQPLLPG